MGDGPPAGRRRVAASRRATNARPQAGTGVTVANAVAVSMIVAHHRTKGTSSESALEPLRTPPSVVAVGTAAHRQRGSDCVERGAPPHERLIFQLGRRAAVDAAVGDGRRRPHRLPPPLRRRRRRAPRRSVARWRRPQRRQRRRRWRWRNRGRNPRGEQPLSVAGPECRVGAVRHTVDARLPTLTRTAASTSSPTASPDCMRTCDWCTLHVSKPSQKICRT